MKRGEFFTAHNSTNGVVAVKVKGYFEDGIGICKAGEYWSATHLVTGLKITPLAAPYKTAKEALSQAKKLIAENREKAEEKIQFTLKSREYQAFLQSMTAQMNPWEVTK